jgi:hypothetical protein
MWLSGTLGRFGGPAHLLPLPEKLNALHVAYLFEAGSRVGVFEGLAGSVEIYIKFGEKTYGFNRGMNRAKFIFQFHNLPHFFGCGLNVRKLE